MIANVAITYEFCLSLLMM